MEDTILEAFLSAQYREGMALAGECDLLDLIPVLDPAARASAIIPISSEQVLMDGPPPAHYIAHFHCRGLIRNAGGEIVEADDFKLGIRFPSDYLRFADTFRTLAWLGPAEIWHPNISYRAPFVCLGRITPGTALVDILYQAWEVITWQKVTMREDDALNHAACVWARRHQDRFPVDRRPLRRRQLALQIDEAE